jgi:hypothetical protein
VFIDERCVAWRVPPTWASWSPWVAAGAHVGDRVRHMAKIWNDAFSLQQLGWTQVVTRPEGKVGKT